MHKNKSVAIIQARMGSSRFPGKVLSPLYGQPLLSWIVQAAAKIALIDDVVIATSTGAADQAIVDWCREHGLSVFTGDESDVLRRFYDTAKHFNADNIVRLTADCPLLHPAIASEVLYLVHSKIADYASNVMPATWPDGTDCEAFTFTALEYAHQHATKKSDREHVTPFIRNQQHLFKVSNIPCPIPNLAKHRWTVDTPEDLAYLEKLLTKTHGNPDFYRLLAAIDTSTEFSQPQIVRNEGFQKSILAENPECNTFTVSQQLLQRALKTIPHGSQTFSKSYIQYPEKVSPHFITHGYQGRVWDVDGNEYVDMVSGLLPNLLGYADPDVNFAINAQLQKGISLSLATELEMQLAEKLCELIPCAEKVRYGKNGTDATSAAVRLARAYTKRDKIIVCGYHGWQDWYIGTTTRNKGIPQAVCELSVSVPYNDLDKIESLLKTERFAAIIMEPCNMVAPQPGYLQGIKDCCEKYGSLFILDEIITGFRFAIGGAQSYFGVTPHLACFGKAIANGMPLSAIVGASDIMREMEDIFFSGTFGGEALSLAAALATIEKAQKHNVVDHLWQFGEHLAHDVEALLIEHDLLNAIKLTGFAPWKLLQFQDYLGANSFEIKTLFMQEMIKRGILIVGSHNVCFTHNALDHAKIVDAYAHTLPIIAQSLKQSSFHQALKAPAIKPLFKVR